MLVADAILNLIALFGVFLAFIIGLRFNKTVLDKKLNALYAILSLFLAARQMFYIFEFPLLVILTMASGAWLPLVILLVTEEVLRRHAPYFVKLTLLGGSAFFSICAVLFGAIWPVFWLVLFAVYAGLSIFITIFFLFANRKNQNAPFETRMADSFAVALIFCAISIILEFRGIFPNIPITFGALGILVFVLTTLSLSSENGSPEKLGIELLALSFSATFLIAAILALNHNLGLGLIIQLWVFAFAINAVLLGLYRSIDKLIKARADGNFIETISQIDDKAGLDSLISAHPMTAAGKVITALDLLLYGDEITQIFMRHRVLSRDTLLDKKPAEALGNLLDENGTNYLLRLSVQPACFLAIATGTIGFSKKLEAELRIFTHLSERMTDASTD